MTKTNLKTQLHTTTTLWVEVPTVDAAAVLVGTGFTEDEFENAVIQSIPDGYPCCLRSGITVDADAMQELLSARESAEDDEDKEDWSPYLWAFMMAMRDLKETPDQYFFHR